MPTHNISYKVVLASPSDLSHERAIVAKIIDEINNIQKATSDYRFELYRWETDAQCNFNRYGPQGQIDEDLKLRDADVLIGLFNLRLGARVIDADSGTEHEIKIAIESWNENQRPDIKLYFSHIPVDPYTVDTEQFSKVNKFRDSVLSKGIIGEFTSIEDFEKKIRFDLSKFLDTEKERARVSPPAPAKPLPSIEPLTPKMLIRQPSGLFTGRIDELLEFKEKIKSSKILVIEGLGGIGKSEFASKCITELSLPKERVVWFECNPDSTTDALIAESGYPDVLKGENKTPKARYSGYTSLMERDELFIFIDDYHLVTDASFKELFDYAKTLLNKARIILLTRTHPAGMSLPVVKLEGLKKDAIEYAKKIITACYNTVEIKDHDLAEICDRLQGHPFAIDRAMLLLSYGTPPDNIIGQIVNDVAGDELGKRLLYFCSAKVRHISFRARRRWPSECVLICLCR